MDGSLEKIFHLEEQVGHKGFIMLTFPHYNPSLRKVRKGTQCRNTEAGSKAEAAEGCCSLVSFGKGLSMEA